MSVTTLQTAERSTPRGLTAGEALVRLGRHGPNALPEKAPVNVWRRFAAQFRSPLIYILLFALVVDLALWLSEGAAGLPLESCAILFILLLNAGLGVYQETKAEAALARSLLPDSERRGWVEKAEAYAAEGFRVLALAWREGEGDERLTFLGLVLLWDPPRAEVPEAIRLARESGIRVLMVTGDHPATALAVANEVGIPPGRVVTGLDLETLTPEELRHAVREANVFARVAPEEKLRLAEALKANGEVVAVTGDGVNDAPALKRSDVGVAMGLRGRATRSSAGARAACLRSRSGRDDSRRVGTACGSGRVMRATTRPLPQAVPTRPLGFNPRPLPRRQRSPSLRRPT